MIKGLEPPIKISFQKLKGDLFVYTSRKNKQPSFEAREKAYE